MRPSMMGMIRNSEDGSEPIKIVYTIGHSNRSMDEFVSILKEYDIRVVVDVRRFPTSRKYPWFSRDALEERFRKEGLTYIWLGDLLGGYRREGYTNYMKTEEYRRGISILLNVIDEKRNTAIMCSEKLWFRL